MAANAMFIIHLFDAVAGRGGVAHEGPGRRKGRGEMTRLLRGSGRIIPADIWKEEKRLCSKFFTKRSSGVGAS